ncbi:MULTISPECIES: hypothetical protein [unclassified Mucilaginibacter]|uniref:hypothetical protein n=1 Tax=unclassified Mucilaginibacter TaxID=2617802 RepID=UPI0009653D77|nr:MULTISPECIES: hypothetical protein [unclassified Mucilaginibacter]OJW18238.1 MAG: hypothetical protein BGO48_16910 [Mucilaginibacter sp. 44-25]PLW91154.1 MAG: hypothetical protein C0154_02730 [Mucilaginibacter sp.]HEK21583.1 hypothetical protein [Bacteroidota bacterium]
MKKLFNLVVLIALLSLSSCVDIEEHYDFKEDGSCKVVYGFDMSKAVSILMNLMTDSVRATPQFSVARDTTLNFYDALPDTTAARLTPEETAMAKSSDLSVDMDLSKGHMCVKMTHLAKTPADLQYYLQHISTVSVKTPAVDLLENNKDKANIKNTDALTLQNFVAGQDYYIYEVTPHSFSRIIDKIKFGKFLQKTRSTFAAAKAMLIDMPYKVVMNFARPVKKVSNPKAVLSADRKQVTLITNMDDVMKDPGLMNLKVDF